MSMTARDLFALTTGATLVLAPAQPKAIVSKSAPKPKTVVATAEVTTPQKRGAKPLQDNDALTTMLDAKTGEPMTVKATRAAIYEMNLGRTEYDAKCAEFGIITRRSLKV